MSADGGKGLYCSAPQQHGGEPVHGGRLRAAAEQAGIALAEWLDLSTGINPVGWPVPPPPQSAWARLPEEEDGLEAAAAEFFGTSAVLPVAGSQAALQRLPLLLPPGQRVGLLHPSYSEHPLAWARAGHELLPLSPEQVGPRLAGLDVLLLVHPNNPTGARFDREQLFGWHAELAAKGGWLIVDEAFIDPTPEESLAPLAPRPGLIVLRSLGKFFGLAGARVGFVIAAEPLRVRLAAELGPWTVSGPARWVATQAVRDYAWQGETRRRLLIAQRRLRDVLRRCALPPSGGTALFQWVRTDAAAEIDARLRAQALLVRRFSDPPSLRFGLPASEPEWQRLVASLRSLSGHKRCR